MQSNMKPILAGLLVLVTVGILVSSLRRGCMSADRYAMADGDTDKALVTRLAKAVAQDREKGEVVLIRFTGLIPSTKKLQELQVDAFQRALPGGYQVVELPPQDLPEDAHGNWVLRTSSDDWGRDLQEWMAPHSNAVAVVSLVGVPKLPPAQWKKLPPFYGVEVVSEPYHEMLLEKGLVAGLAIMREDADAVAIREFRGSRDELFDLAYEYRSP